MLVGDIVILNVGDKIPADCILIWKTDEELVVEG